MINEIARWEHQQQLQERISSHSGTRYLEFNPFYVALKLECEKKSVWFHLFDSPESFSFPFKYILCIFNKQIAFYIFCDIARLLLRAQLRLKWNEIQKKLGGNQFQRLLNNAISFFIEREERVRAIGMQSWRKFPEGIVIVVRHFLITKESGICK